MNARRNHEIKAVVTAFTIAAALVSGLLTVRDSHAAPPTKKKSTVTVKSTKKAKPVYVKMSGSRRAAETRARQLYADALAQKAADAQAVTDAQVVASEAETAVAASSSMENTSANGAYNPYAVNSQQVSYPGVGSFGPVVSGYGPSFGGVSGFSIGNIYGSGYPGSGFGYPNGGYGYPNSGAVGYPNNGINSNNGGFGGYSGFQFGF